MEDLIKAVILGIVEGLTEFLPISSTGHLILVNQWITFDEQFTKMFDVVIQLGAILSVIIYFWPRLNPFDKGKTIVEQHKTFDLWKKAILGILPMMVLGFIFKALIDRYLFNPIVVSLALVVGGVLLYWIESQKKRSTINSVAEMSYQTVMMIGLFQCLAMVPGTSRSAATIIGAMLLGTSRVVAVEYSFFLAIPTMIAASGYSLLKEGLSWNSHELLVLGVGFGVSFFVAWLVIAGLMNFIGKRDFKVFAGYRIVLGIVILLGIYSGLVK